MFTLPADQLPGGRGHGEPVRLMVELEENHDFVEICVHEPGRKLLVAATSGHGFIVPEDEMVAMTRKGKQVMNVDRARGGLLASCRSRATLVATIGENRKMLIFPLEEVNEMTRGKGVILQRYKDGALVRPARLQKVRWLELARPGGTDLHADHGGAQRLAGPARPVWPPGTQGLSQVEQVRSLLLDEMCKLAPRAAIQDGAKGGCEKWRRRLGVAGGVARCASKLQRGETCGQAWSG